MPTFRRLKKPRTTVTIENRGGTLIRVTTHLTRKARERWETIEPYNPLPDLRPVPSIWQ
jgi:hypothetical protein